VLVGDDRIREFKWCATSGRVMWRGEVVVERLRDGM